MLLFRSVLLQTLNITPRHYLAYAWLWGNVCIGGANILGECFQALVSLSSLNYPVVRHWSGSDKIIVRLLWNSCSQWTFWSLLAASCLVIWESVWKRSKTLMPSKCWWIAAYSQRSGLETVPWDESLLSLTQCLIWRQALCTAKANTKLWPQGLWRSRFMEPPPQAGIIRKHFLSFTYKSMYFYVVFVVHPLWKCTHHVLGTCWDQGSCFLVCCRSQTCTAVT